MYNFFIYCLNNFSMSRKNNYLFTLFNIFLFFSFGNLFAFELNAEDKINNTETPLSSLPNLKLNNLEDKQYILDSGDVLRITFERIDIFSNDYSIDREGFLELPEIHNYSARGKTISEITRELNKKYEDFI